MTLMRFFMRKKKKKMFTCKILATPYFDFTFLEETSKKFPENFICITTGMNRVNSEHDVANVDPLLLNICVGKACQQRMRSYFVKNSPSLVDEVQVTSNLQIRLFIHCGFNTSVQNQPEFRWVFDVSVAAPLNNKILLPEVTEITEKWETDINILNDPTRISEFMYVLYFRTNPCE
ncbi:hypothetical protein HMI54_000200 [Coelomomyces lativittatus]|nr:hypothetical protein HMI54_000200 [Coelomomyces lativittatus]